MKCNIAVTLQLENYIFYLDYLSCAIQSYVLTANGVECGNDSFINTIRGG